MIFQTGKYFYACSVPQVSQSCSTIGWNWKLPNWGSKGTNPHIKFYLSLFIMQECQHSIFNLIMPLLIPDVLDVLQLVHILGPLENRAKKRAEVFGGPVGDKPSAHASICVNVTTLWNYCRS